MIRFFFIVCFTLFSHLHPTIHQSTPVNPNAVYVVLVYHDKSFDILHAHDEQIMQSIYNASDISQILMLEFHDRGHYRVINPHEYLHQIKKSPGVLDERRYAQKYIADIATFMYDTCAQFYQFSRLTALEYLASLTSSHHHEN